MTFTTLINAEDAFSRLSDASWAFIDCRAALGKPSWGQEQYERGHIPGAVYVDLETDLSGPVVPGVTGRHPLPRPRDVDALVSKLGIQATTQVVAYDESSGAMAAARLWWLLRWAGHERVAVLNGGFRNWQACGFPVRTGSEGRPACAFAGEYQMDMVATAGEILDALPDGRMQLIDVRAGELYRGESEPIDPVAGHIPGAVSLPYDGSLHTDGSFRAPAALRDHFATGVDFSADDPPIFYCGSGVTAAHSVLAVAHAGFGVLRLYPGSWSEWITDPNRPRA